MRTLINDVKKCSRSSTARVCTLPLKPEAVEEKNMEVLVVGDQTGPEALREVLRNGRQHGAGNEQRSSDFTSDDLHQRSIDEEDTDGR